MAEARWLDEAETRAWRGHLRMTWLLDAAIARDLADDSGLSHADYYVLARLSECPSGRMRMSELAGDIHWSRSRLSHQIGRMEERGLVRRDGCPSDSRGTFAVLLPAGRGAITAAAPAHVESIRRHLLDRLSGAQVAALGDIAEAVVEPLTGRCASVVEAEGDCPGTPLLEQPCDELEAAPAGREPRPAGPRPSPIPRT